MAARGADSTSIPWGHHLAVAAAYAACYELTRHFSFSHWILTAGLRLAALLLVPKRFWTALVVGETLPVAEAALLCIPRFGVLWGVVGAIPTIPLCMPVVLAVLRRMDLYDEHGQPKMATLLVATLGCAMVTAVRADATVFTAYFERPGGIRTWLDEVGPDSMAYLLGSYLGALTLTPVLIFLRACVGLHGLTVRDAVRLPLFRDMLFIVVPTLLGLAAIARTGGPAAQELARLALVLPVVAATLRYGWEGGALSGMLASIAMACTANVLLDPAMIRAQVVLSLAISAALVAGARMTQRVVRAPGITY